MKEYKLTDSIIVKLNKITPRTLKSFSELGLYFTNGNDNVNEIQTFLTCFLDDVKLKKLLSTLFIFDGDIAEDIDASIVFEGYSDFLSQLSLPLVKSAGLTKTPEIG